MKKELEKEKSSSSMPILSGIGLVILLGAIIYGMPYLQGVFDQFKPKSESKEDVEVSEIIIPQSSAELTEWVPLVVKQLPAGEEVKFSLIQMRLSADGQKLLLDLEKSWVNKIERFDLVLKRDEFGRFISDHPEISLKLYPPEKTEASP